MNIQLKKIALAVLTFTFVISCDKDDVPVTTDSTAKQIPHELSNFVVTELKNMAAEAQVDLNIKDQKQKILEQAKEMSVKELMEKMKVDSTFAKVVLEK